MKKNLIEYLVDIVNLKENSIAIVENENEINFRQLYESICSLGNCIINKSDILNKPIAIYLPKSINCVVADLGVMISGNAYLNLDIKSPIQRIKNILDLVKPEFIITTSSLLNEIRSIYTLDKIILIDKINLVHNNDDTNLLSRLNFRSIDTDMSCIINTSGSTGTPKSVALNHKSFIDFIEVSDQIFHFSDREIIGSLSPVIFDIFSYELCMLISKGSCIVVLPENMAAFPIKILEEMKRTNVSFIFWVPTIMVNIANMDLLTKVNLETLKLVWFAGEVFPTKQFNYWKRILSQTKFANLYGPIEITLDCTYFIVDRDFEDNEPLPIGIPYRNTDILILTDEDLLASHGQEGELCVRGTSLALGYYNNPEKTTAAFVQNPLNKHYPEIIYRTGDIVSLNERNEIVFRGRKDTLIKHQGYRIELGEVEHIVVNTLKIVKNACCVYKRDQKEIVLYYENNEDIPVVDFRKTLLTALPKYMIPSVFIRYDEMPRNPNGKIDRAYLNHKANN